MKLLKDLWQDEAGHVLSAEAVVLGTVGVAGACVGLGTASKAMNDELSEVASSFRSLNQSFCLEGQSGCGAWTAPSFYVQPPPECARIELKHPVEEHEADPHGEVAPPLPDDERDRKFKRRRREHFERLQSLRDRGAAPTSPDEGMSD